MKKITTVIAGILMTASSLNISAQEFSKKDQDFIKEAASGGLAEVLMGDLAQTHGANPMIKEMGSMMVKDHSQANRELKELAKKKNMVLPELPEAKEQRRVDDLKDKKGKDFDKDYASIMVKDHKKDIEAFQKAAKDADDPELRKWAAGKVKTLEHHLNMAQRTEEDLKKTDK